MKYNRDTNQLPYISNGALKNFTPKAYNSQALEINMNSGFNNICSLFKKQKLNVNRCNRYITTCDTTKYEYCINDDVGIHCKNGLVYGNHKFYINKHKHKNFLYL